jgi:hypothetical protein
MEPTRDRLVVRVGTNPPCLGLMIPGREPYIVWVDAAWELALAECEAVHTLEPLALGGPS